MEPYLQKLFFCRLIHTNVNEFRMLEFAGVCWHLLNQCELALWYREPLFLRVCGLLMGFVLCRVSLWSTCVYFIYTNNILY